MIRWTIAKKKNKDKKLHNKVAYPEKAKLQRRTTGVVPKTKV